MKREVKDSRDGKKNIVLLGSASLFNDIGSEAITPLIPFYTTALGGTGIAIGLISGLREGLSSLFNLFGGWLSDRLGKRKFLVFLGYLISTIFKFFIGAANSWQSLTAAVGFERFGKSRDAPRDVIISNSTKRKGHGFGFHQMMDRVGAIIGTLMVVFLFWKLQLGIKTILYIAAGIAALSIIPVFFVKDKQTKKIKKNLFTGIKELNPKLKYFIFVSSVFTLGNFGLYLFLLLRAQQISGSIVVPLIIYAIFNLVFAFFVTPFGTLSDRIGRKKVLTAGYILFFLIAICFIFVNNIFVLAVLFSLYGLVYALTDSSQTALVSDLSGDMKGTALGFYGFVTGLVNIVAGLIAGILWDISYSTMFIYLSVVAFISIILIMFVKRNK
jgi:MFS family permease